MGSTRQRNVLLLVPIFVTVAVALAACGTPCVAGSNAGAPVPAAPNYASGPATSNTTGNGGATLPFAASGSGGSTGSTAGTQFGSSSGTIGGSASPGGASGFGSGGSSGSSSPYGMTPDQIALWCKSGSMGDPDTNTIGFFGIDANQLRDLRRVSPVQMQPDIDLLISDYSAIAGQTRVYPQLRDEIKVALQHIAGYYTQLCTVH